MARTATVRSASLAPEEIALVDRLAEQLAGGSFTELTRRLLRVFGEPLSHRLDDLVEAGMDPHEQLVLLNPTLAATEVRAASLLRSVHLARAGPQRPSNLLNGGLVPSSFALLRVGRGFGRDRAGRYPVGSTNPAGDAPVSS